MAQPGSSHSDVLSYLREDAPVMARRRILTIGHPALRKPGRAVGLDALATDAMQQLIDDLVETMHAAHGAGLAATQIGEPVRITVIEVKDNPRYPYKPDYPLTVLVNPELTILSDERFESFEGCLSVPNLRGKVMRHAEIGVRAWDRRGELIEREVRGLTAGTFQHEVDHLDGELFVDKVFDPHTLCTWEQFDTFHAEAFSAAARALVERWGA